MAILPTAFGPYSALEERFEVLAHIGQGSFGDVWKARNLTNGAIVALKIPKDQELGEEVLRQEPDLMKALDHPHIVHIYGCHTIGSQFVIEMEYVEGHNLGEILESTSHRTPITYGRILKWAKQILEGLAEIHAAQVVHNDIKPQNVLIDQNDNAKLVDFGTSRRMEDVWVWTRRQGTEAYWAPEVAFDQQRSYVSDIYSVGVMLYEMVTGQLPYRSPFELGSGRAIVRPREINANVSPALEAVILQAMARDPRERYADCQAMLHDVDAVLLKLVDAEGRAPRTKTGAHRSSLSLDTSSPLYYLDQAKLLLAAGNIPAALEAAEVAAERSGGHPHYLRMLAGVYLKQGYTHKALETYERVWTAYQQGAPATNPQRQDVLERLGELYVKNKDYPKAVKIYEQLLAITDKPIFVRFRLAVAAGLNADYRRAIQLLEEVCKERPNVAVVYGKLGYAYELQGNYRQALSYYNQALMLDPAELRSLYQLGRYYKIMGEKARSQSYFQRLRANDQRQVFTEIATEYAAD